MSKGNPVISARIDNETLKELDNRALEKGLTRADYLISLIKADITRIENEILKGVEKRALEKGLTRADYILSLIKADLESKTSDTPHKRKRHRKRRRSKQLSFQSIIDGFKPLVDRVDPPGSG